MYLSSTGKQTSFPRHLSMERPLFLPLLSSLFYLWAHLIIRKRHFVWMSHFVPMCKSIVLLDFLHMCTPSHRKSTFQSNGSSPHKSLTAFGSEKTRWQKPSRSRSEEVLESNLQLHTVNLIRAWRAQGGLLSISRIPNQRPGWPAPRTKDAVNYEFSIQTEGLICHYHCRTVGIKPAELLGF